MPVVETTFERLRTILDAYEVTDGDIGGPILRRVGQTHRKQMRQVFATEGASGGAGSWPALSPRYADWKRKFLGKKGKILVLDKPYGGRAPGQMKESFIEREHVSYVQQYDKPYLQFGSRDPLAVKHFLGVAPLPKRDMISKSPAQLKELVQAVIDWWDKERYPQIQRSIAALSRGRK